MSASLFVKDAATSRFVAGGLSEVEALTVEALARLDVSGAADRTEDRALENEGEQDRERDLDDLWKKLGKDED